MGPAFKQLRCVEQLPRGANFKRAKVLWELGLHIAGNPLIPYGGDRDMCITVGSGSGESFRPALKLATGSAILAHAVVKGDIDMAFVNPSAMLTQAYRGVGLFTEKLPVRIIGSYPSFDRFVMTIRKSLGFRSLADVKAARYPLKISIREDPTHSTLVLIEQLLAAYGMSLADIESWGGKPQRVGGPGAKERLDALRAGTIDAVFDEGIRTWLPTALDHEMVVLQPDAEAGAQLAAFGWRHVLLPAALFPQLTEDQGCIDFGGWPLYARAALPDQVAYDVCAAFAARQNEMPWETPAYTGITQVFHETDATPMDVPLHPGAARWYDEHPNG
jgi:TRAP-type uncharacterized transport system substrate-binding protein